MNHARVFLVSAIVSALAACGGGGEDGSSGVNGPSSVNGAGAASNAASTANSSATVSSDVTATVNGQTLSATQAAVVQANDAAAAAQQQAEETQARLAAERAVAEEARQQAAEAAERAAAAEAQNRAAAEQAAREAAARNEALQQRLNEAEAQAREAQEAARAQAAQLAQAENKLAAAANRDAQQPAAPTENPAIPDCSQNAAAVDDPETGLKLVCESQITSAATTADVGTAKHASGRYYALSFPDKTMLFLGNKIGYKMACGDKICEWQKLGGSMDIVYAAQGKDGNYHRFTTCRKGKADRLICAYPSTGKPDGVHVDDREPEVHRIGAAITDTDTSGKRGFRAGAETSAPRGCDYGYTGSYSAAMGLTHVVFPGLTGACSGRQGSGGGWPFLTVETAWVMSGWNLAILTHRVAPSIGQAQTAGSSGRQGLTGR